MTGLQSVATLFDEGAVLLRMARLLLDSIYVTASSFALSCRCERVLRIRLPAHPPVCHLSS